jgi:hypothetical protein
MGEPLLGGFYPRALVDDQQLRILGRRADIFEFSPIELDARFADQLIDEHGAYGRRHR